MGVGRSEQIVHNNMSENAAPDTLVALICALNFNLAVLENLNIKLQYINVIYVLISEGM